MFALCTDMAGAQDSDELTILFARVRGFFTSWVLLLVAVVTGWLLFGLALELVMVAIAGAGGDGEGEHPLTLSVLWAFGAAVTSVVLGPPLVLMRRHIVRPDFPVLHLGYVAVAAIPFAIFGMGMGSEPGWYWIPVYVQAPMLATAGIYVVLARWFGLFAAEAGLRPRGLLDPDGEPPDSA